LKLCATTLTIWNIVQSSLKLIFKSSYTFSSQTGAFSRRSVTTGSSLIHLLSFSYIFVKTNNLYQNVTKEKTG